jgi:hypothetical protein
LNTGAACVLLVHQLDRRHRALGVVDGGVGRQRDDLRVHPVLPHDAAGDVGLPSDDPGHDVLLPDPDATFLAAWHVVPEQELGREAQAAGGLPHGVAEGLAHDVHPAAALVGAVLQGCRHDAVAVFLVLRIALDGRLDHLTLTHQLDEPGDPVQQFGLVVGVDLSVRTNQRAGRTIQVAARGQVCSLDSGIGDPRTAAGMNQSRSHGDNLLNNSETLAQCVQ